MYRSLCKCGVQYTKWSWFHNVLLVGETLLLYYRQSPTFNIQVATNSTYNDDKLTMFHCYNTQFWRYERLSALNTMCILIRWSVSVIGSIHPSTSFLSSSLVLAALHCCFAYVYWQRGSMCCCSAAEMHICMVMTAGWQGPPWGKWWQRQGLLPLHSCHYFQITPPTPHSHQSILTTFFSSSAAIPAALVSMPTTPPSLSIPLSHPDAVFLCYLQSKYISAVLFLYNWLSTKNWVVLLKIVYQILVRE